MKLLITTGATVTFKPLVEFLLQDEMINLYANSGITSVFVQYGNEIKQTHKSQEFINSVFPTTKTFQHFQLTETIGNLEVSTPQSSCPIKFEFFPFSPNLSDFIERSDLIISHGGTGTLIDILKFNKKLLVVYNEALMGNHQAQIALEFEKSGYCISIGSSELEVKKLTRIIGDMVEKKFVAYKQTGGDVLQKIVYTEVVRAKR